MKASLHILLICKSMPWRFKGGIQTHSWELAKSLTQAGHQVSVLTGGAFREGEKTYDKEGIQLIEVPYWPGRYLKPISLLAEEFSFNYKVRQWVKQNHGKYDVVHIQGRSGYLLHTVKALRHKTVATLHGLLSKETARQHWTNLNAAIHRGVTKYHEERTYEHATQCITVSQSLKADVQKQCAQLEAEVIPNGVKFQNTADMMIGTKPPRFLFVGRLHSVKGILPLVKAMRHAPEHYRLDVIGDGPQKDEIQSTIEKYGLEQRVRLLGAYPNEKVQQVLPYYKALVLPSHYETQGIVLLEALACAVPVIASDIPAIRETIEHGQQGLLCPPDQPASFIKAMQQMTEQDLETQLMGIRGRKAMQHTADWDAVAERTIEVYQRLAS